MKTKDSTYTEFYQKLGKLFFGIAYADKVVHPNEVAYLYQTIREYWIPLENSTDEFGSDAAHQIEIVFDWLVEQDFVPYDCLDEFAEFKKENPQLFTDEINRSIWNCSEGIAASYAGKNKSELVTLSRLQSILLS